MLSYELNLTCVLLNLAACLSTKADHIFFNFLSISLSILCIVDYIWFRAIGFLVLNPGLFLTCDIV